MSEPANQPPTDQVILYQTEGGTTRLEVRLKGETVWLSLSQMAELFQRDKSVISRHIANIFEDGEFPPSSVVANFAPTATDGKTYQVDYWSMTNSAARPTSSFPGWNNISWRRSRA